MSQALINRSLTNVRTELEFLYESNVITKNLYDNLISALPERYTGQPAVDLKTLNDNNNSNTPMAVQGTGQSQISHMSQQPPPPQQQQQPQGEYAEVIYEFQPQQATDLKLSRGDKIQILEKLSPDWWKGRIGSQEGVFPSNYVRLLSSSSDTKSQQQQQNFSPPSQPPPQYQQPQYQQGMYQQPPAPIVQQSSTPQQPFPPQQQPVQAQQQHQSMSNAHPHISKFGKQLKDAAVFGAGATIGSDIVNSIF